MSDPASALEAALEERLDGLLKAAVPPGGDPDGVRLAVETIFSSLRTLHQVIGDDTYAANIHGLVAEMAVLIGIDQTAAAAAPVTADSATTGAAFAKAAAGMAALTKDEGK